MRTEAKGRVQTVSEGRCSAREIVSFYLGQSPDNGGRMIDEIHGWDHDHLEYIHDYIQWLFPLTERSNVSPDAPVLDEAQIEAFRTDGKLKAKLIKSFKLMLSFYGLQCDDTGATIEVFKSEKYPERKRIWLNHGNHNYLRITRILTSLRILGLEEYAQAFFDFLDELYRGEGGRIGQITYGYWERAVR